MRYTHAAVLAALLLALLLPVPVHAGAITPCGLVNPSFEAFDDFGHPIGWNGGHATDHTGWMGKVPDGKAYGYAVEEPMTQDVPVDIGSSYSLIFWSGSHAPGHQTVELAYLDKDGYLIQSQVHTITTDVDESPKILGGPYGLSLPAAPANADRLRVMVDAHGVDWAKVDALCLTQLVPAADGEETEPTPPQQSVEVMVDSGDVHTYRIKAHYAGAHEISFVALLEGIDGRYTSTTGADTVDATVTLNYSVTSVLFHADGELVAVVTRQQFWVIGEPASTIGLTYLPLLTK